MPLGHRWSFFVYVQAMKEGCRPCGLHITATDLVVYV